jgi:hypothetical protein
MPLRQMLATLGSAEIQLWIAEFQLRAKEEEAAYERAREEAEQKP